MRQARMILRSLTGILFVVANSPIRDHIQRVLMAKPTAAPCAMSSAEARTSRVSPGTVVSMLPPAMSCSP